MNKIYIFLLPAFLYNSLSAAVVVEGKRAEAIARGTKKIILNEESRIPSFIQFREESSPGFSDVTLWLQKKFAWDAGFALKLISGESDRLGYVHYRFKQTFNDIPLEGTMWIVHIRNEKIVSMNGWLADKISMESKPVLSVQDARQKALQYSGAETFKWNVPEEEKLLKKITNDSSASYFPKGKLVYAYDSHAIDKRIYKPAYLFDIYSDKPVDRKYIYVDACTGNVVDIKSGIHEFNSTGLALTAYSGLQGIVTDSVQANTFLLHENTRGIGLGMETYNLHGGTNYGNAIDFTDNDNFWNNVNADLDQYATDAHLAAEKSYDYFYSRFGRNSIDNVGLRLFSYVHYSSSYVNAFWDGFRMIYGDGNYNHSPLTTLDIGGHEITHGLTQYTADLNYAYEPGALNESFSDCLGTAIEWYGDSSHADWLIGEDIGAAFRSLAQPKLFGQPDTYRGINWFYGSADYGGVHTNSGVQNYWFYLLSTGGNGTNDNGDVYSVGGIGIDKAAEIVFRTLTVYLTSTSQYIDARNYSIQAAIDLFGNCSPEVASTINAWFAVGIGTKYDFPPSVNCMGGSTVCSGDTVRLYAEASFGSAYQWYVNTQQIQGAVNSYYEAIQTGTYYLETSTCGNVRTSNNFSVHVVSFSPEINPSGSVSSCERMLLSANNSNGFSVQWNRNGIPISGATDSAYTVSMTGNYTVTFSPKPDLPAIFTNQVAMTIPNNVCAPHAVSIIPVGGLPSGISTSGISITINVTHTWDEDLMMTLEAPNGDILGLSNMAGGSGHDFVNTVFTDTASVSIVSGLAPFSGYYKPWLSTFASCIQTTKNNFASIGNGTINPNGEWKLHVYDIGGSGVGTIDNWSIQFPPVINSIQNCGPYVSDPTYVSIGTNASSHTIPEAIYEYRFLSKNDFPGNPRAFGIAASLNGKGYYGLGDNGFKNDWWEYNSLTDSWTQKDNCPAAFSGGTAITLGNCIYVVCGYNGNYLNSVYQWNSINNTWTQKNNFPGGARAYLSSCVISGKGYVVGGADHLNSFQDIWEYDPLSDQWLFRTALSTAGTGFKGITAFSLGSKMYCGLGQHFQVSGSPQSYSKEWFEYDPLTNTVIVKNNFPGNARTNADGFSTNDKGYICFGNSGLSLLNDCWEYNNVTDTWKPAGAFAGNSFTGSSAVTIHNAVYIFGGNTFSGPSPGVIQFKVFSNICSDDSLAISLTASEGTSYVWNTGELIQTITGISSGDYAVLVNNNGCSSTAYTNVAIYPATEAHVSVNGPLNFCLGETVELTADSCTAYLWNNGLTTQSITVDTSGNYFVTATGAGGCTNSSIPIAVNAYPGPPVSVLPGGSTALCQGNSLILKAYGYQSIPFAPISGNGISINLSDDQLSTSLPIGFAFTFFNNTYTGFYISSNGFITFEAGHNGCCSGQILPDTTAPNNLIAFAWNDLYPPAGGTVEYFTTGATPNRKLVVNFKNIDHWYGGNPVTAQVILFETSNLIEIHTTHLNGAGTSHTMGIENSDGTQAVIFPARNGTNWNATNDGVRFGTQINSYVWNTGSTAEDLIVTSSGTYSVEVSDVNDCRNSSLGSAVLFSPCSTIVNLKIYIQGFYKGGGLMEAVLDKSGRPLVCDSVALELHENAGNRDLIFTVKNVIDIYGNGVFEFPIAWSNTGYYLVVKHRNSLETWSSMPVYLEGPSISYDFTSSSSRSFGNNEVNLGAGVYGIYSGDINQDQLINQVDRQLFEAAALSFLSGYINEDLTGDGVAESSDFSVLENNIQSVVGILRP